MEHPKKKNDESIEKRSFLSRHKILIGIAILIVLIIGYFAGKNLYTQYQSDAYQKSIEAFYVAPSPLPSLQPGALLRQEKMNISVPEGGTAYRILYNTQLANGEPAISSGMIFVPQGTPPPGGRKVVAWAHGTLGFGDACAPSRSETDPMNDMQNWLDAMMQRGWVVVATDYTGVGTKGEPYYLIGQSEAHDVLNSVRAARNFSPASAGSDFAVWGHSQGGHSSLFSAAAAKSYAPELSLLAAAAAAPAAEMPSLLSQQYNQVISWGIGPDVAVSWPQVYPDLPIQSTLTSAAYKNYQRLAYGCITQEVTGLEIRGALNQKFFKTDPLENAQWYEAATAQTPPVSSITVPIYIAQGLSDPVVLPNTTALLVQQACQNKQSITTNWLGNTSHTQVAMIAGPSVTAWLQDRFNKLPAGNSCDQPLPITPASVRAAPNN